MELSWSTILLEMINFLVLVWILKRFLFQPVMDIIARRKAGIEQTLADAATLKADAEKLEAQYRHREADWAREREQAREALARELAAERANGTAKLNAELEQARRKAQVADERRQADLLLKAHEAALLLGARFATRLLAEAAGQDTETRLFALAIDGLNALDDKRIAALRNSHGKLAGEAVVASAFPLSDGQRRQVGEALERVVGAAPQLRFVQDSDLLAGIRITIGPWVLGANVRDELKGFTDLSRDD